MNSHVFHHAYYLCEYVYYAIIFRDGWGIWQANVENFWFHMKMYANLIDKIQRTSFLAGNARSLPGSPYRKVKSSGLRNSCGTNMKLTPDRSTLKPCYPFVSQLSAKSPASPCNHYSTHHTISITSLPLTCLFQPAD